MKKSNANKATHSGTCQICGRLQKLPHGILSKHGYTTRWGFFMGTCPGANYQPFELSCDRIQAAINDAEVHSEALMAQASELKAYTGDTAWVRNYYSKNYVGAYKWERAVITSKHVQYGKGENDFFNGLFQTVTTETSEAKGIEKKLDCYYGERTVAAAVKELNERYIVKLNQDIAKLNEYIAWQTERVANWKANPEALVPVK